MAYRDRSQGFGFVYVDVNKLMQNLKDGRPTTAQVVNFNKDILPEQKKPEVPVVLSEREAILNRLDALQAKLQKLLADMEEPPPLLTSGGKKK